MNKNSNLVYSTATGRIKTGKISQTTDEESDESGDGVVRIFRENRKGSGVSLIRGLPGELDKKALARLLKKKLGVGGSIKAGVIEIQTGQREKIRTLLENPGLKIKGLPTKGLRVKIAGG